MRTRAQMVKDTVAGAFASAKEKVWGNKTNTALLAAGVLAGLAVGISLIPARDGEQYMTEDAKCITQEQSVATSAGAVDVLRVAPSEILQAADTLSSALCQDEVIVACAAESHNASSRSAALKGLYKLVLKACLPSSSGCLCLQSKNKDAIAVWLPKGIELDVAGLALGGGVFALGAFGGWARYGRFWAYSQAVEPRRQRLTAQAPGGYFYLLLNAAAQGCAEGSGAAAMPSNTGAREAVILPVLQRADVTGVPCFAEVTNVADLPFFTGLGFATVDDFTLFGCVILIMMRPPKARAA